MVGEHRPTVWFHCSSLHWCCWLLLLRGCGCLAWENPGACTTSRPSCAVACGCLGQAAVGGARPCLQVKRGLDLTAQHPTMSHVVAATACTAVLLQVNWGVDLTEGKAQDPWKNALLSEEAKETMWRLHNQER